mgnify:CR=1 FL=1
MMAKASFDGTQLAEASFQFVRHNDRNETVPCALAEEAAELADIRRRSAEFATALTVSGDAVRIEPG